MASPCTLNSCPFKAHGCGPTATVRERNNAFQQVEQQPGGLDQAAQQVGMNAIQLRQHFRADLDAFKAAV